MINKQGIIKKRVNGKKYKLIFDVVSRNDGENHYRLQSLEENNKVESPVETDRNVSTPTWGDSTIDNSIPPSNQNVKYSLSAPAQDNQGRELSKGQQTYFRV